MTIDPSKIVTFNKSIVISKQELSEQTEIGESGQIRFNNTTFKFEGYHGNFGTLFGNPWRQLTQDIATASNLGIIKVGQNLSINPATGVLSSFATGSGRFSQLVITVSPIPGAGDYTSINTAISNAIGTLAGGYIDGSLTSNLGSPPSPIWPFVIQLGPGQFNESSNQIILPDYVSLIGESNFNSVINLNTGNTTIQSGSLIITGTNTIIKDIAFSINDTNLSDYANIIYSDGKQGIKIDNCIFTSNAICNTTGTLNYIYMSNTISSLTSNTISNQIKPIISNNQFIINSGGSFLSPLEINPIYIESSAPDIINNKITIYSPYSNVNTAIKLINCDTGIPSNNNKKPFINNLEIINNYENTITGNISNYGLYISNTSCDITNSRIECTNDTSFGSNNIAIYIPNTGNSSIISSTSTDILSMSNNNGISPYLLTSSNTSIVNFITLGLLPDQWLYISGSQDNNGLYKIGDVISASILSLATGYTFTDEPASVSANINLRVLHDININNTVLSATTNAIVDDTNITNIHFNLKNVNIPSAGYSFTNSQVSFTNYKTLTIGKENCDFTLLSDAIEFITNTNSGVNIPYQIYIQPGTYIESTPITIPAYVNINGCSSSNNRYMGNDDSNNATIIQFYNGNTASPTPDTNSSCLNLTGGYNYIRDLKIINTTKNIPIPISASNSSAIINISNATNINLTDIILFTQCGTDYNYAIYCADSNNIHLSTVNITLNQLYNTTTDNNAIYFNNSRNITLLNSSCIINAVDTNYNTAIYFKDSGENIRIINPYISVGDGNIQNRAIYTENTILTPLIIEITGGFISATDALEYSIYADNYYTIICNGVDIRGDTYTSAIQSRIICNGCYTITGNSYSADYQTLNSRGQNEQALGTITIGDTAGRLNSTGINNLLIGVQSGSNITTSNHNTFLGANTGSSLTDAANNNVLIGSYAGNNISNGSGNTLIGSNVAPNISIGNNNIIMGYSTAGEMVSGNMNIFIGANTCSSIDNGELNTIIGSSTLDNLISGNKNVLMGGDIASNMVSGSQNIIIGNEASSNTTAANNTVIIGYQTAFNNQSNGITAVGNWAGWGNTTGIKNTFLGYNAGFNNVSGDVNTIIGNNAGSAGAFDAGNSGIVNGGITGSANTLIGNETGYNLSTGTRNILIGSTSSSSNTSNDSAGWALTTGADNIIVGVKAGSKAISTINNVLIGSNAGGNITTAGNSVLIGSQSGTKLGTIGQSVIIGTNAGETNTGGNAVLIGYNAGVKNTDPQAFSIGYSAGYNVTGTGNMFMGYSAGGLPGSATTGSFNMAIGPFTGYNLTSGTRNILIGTGDSFESTGRQITVGSDNTLLGFKAGRAIQTGSANTLIGSNAGANLTNGINNLILGHNSAFNLNTGSYNISLGTEAGYNTAIGNYNIFTGYQSGYGNTQGAQNINIGYQSGYTSTNNTNNIHIGTQAGYLSQADNNILIGNNAGIKNTAGTNNIFMGYNTGAGNNAYGTSGEQTGNFNIFLGYQAGNTNYNGNRNIYLGYQAGRDNQQGLKNIFIGDNAGYQSAVSHNIFIGTASNNNKGIGYQATGAGEYNVFIGHNAGVDNTTGQQNIFIGDGAGNANTTGENNIYIGTNAGQDGNAAAADNNIAIGKDAGKNNQSGYQNILIGKDVASLSTSVDYNQNIIIGANAGQNIQQDNQIFIGTNAGQDNTTGDRNIFIGLNAGTTNTISQDNIIIGSDAGVSMVGNAGIGDNVIIGSQAAHDLTTGTNNIFIGSNSGGNAITAQNCVAIGANSMSVGNASNVVIIGNQAGKNNNTDNNIFIGLESGFNNTNGINNLFVGTKSGYTNTTGGNNILVGYNAGYTNNGDFNLFFGFNAGFNNISGESNIFFGQSAGYNNNADFNIFLGFSSGYTNTSGTFNLFLGYESGYNNLIGYQNIFQGYQTGKNNTTGYDNTFIGTSSGYTNTTGFDNVFMGLSSGHNNTEGIENIYIGKNAGYNINGTPIPPYINDNQLNSSRNICIGSHAGVGNNLAPASNVYAFENVFIGSYSGAASTSAYKNVCLGSYSGYWMGNGKGNIYLGYGSGADNYANGISGDPDLAGNYNICIGTQSGTYINGTDGNMCLGFYSGYYVGWADTNDYNSYIGLQCAQTNSGSNNIFIGSEIQNYVNAATITSVYSNKFGVYKTTTHDIVDNTDANHTMLIGGDFSTGTVGIGTIIPDSYIGTTISETATKLVVLGKVLANAYTLFTGAHMVLPDANIPKAFLENDLIPGMIVYSKDSVLYDINNMVSNVAIADTYNDKRVLGVYCNREESIVVKYDPEPPFSANSNVVVTTSNIITTTYYVNSLGEGGILVSNITGNIQNGDYITSSIIPGYGCLQADDILHSYTVAKCTQNIDWNSVSENILCSSDGKMYKSLMVGCTYHCG